MIALIETPPTTLAGLKAAIAYFLEWDETIPDDTGDFLRTLLGSPLLAEKERAQ